MSRPRYDMILKKLNNIFKMCNSNYTSHNSLKIVKMPQVTSSKMRFRTVENSLQERFRDKSIKNLEFEDIKASLNSDIHKALFTESEKSLIIKDSKTKIDRDQLARRTINFSNSTIDFKNDPSAKLKFKTKDAFSIINNKIKQNLRQCFSLVDEKSDTPENIIKLINNKNNLSTIINRRYGNRNTVIGKKIKLLIPKESKTVKGEAGNSATISTNSNVKAISFADFIDKKTEGSSNQEQNEDLLTNSKPHDGNFINNKRKSLDPGSIIKKRTYNHSQKKIIGEKVEGKIKSRVSRFHHKTTQNSVGDNKLNDSNTSSSSSSSKEKIDMKKSCIEIFKKTVRKIKIANRFLKQTFGTIKVTLQKDLDKEKYLEVMGVFIRVAKECYSCKFRTGFLEIFIEILKISMKVPDLPVIRYSYLLLGMISEYLKDYPNAVFACQRLIDFSEGEDELLTAIRALQILGNVYEDK